MKLTTVKSSNVEALGYDEQQRALVVKFKGGNVYQYSDVSADIAAGLFAAESIGSYLSSRITKNKEVPCRRLTTDEVAALTQQERADGN